MTQYEALVEASEPVTVTAVPEDTTKTLVADVTRIWSYHIPGTAAYQNTTRRYTMTAQSAGEAAFEIPLPDAPTGVQSEIDCIPESTTLVFKCLVPGGTMLTGYSLTMNHVIEEIPEDGDDDIEVVVSG